MNKVGRNQPCHCGSGKKYKRCCEAADEAARAPTSAHEEPRARSRSAWVDDDDDQLDERSNRVIALIRDGRLDEAEAAANDLLSRYPGLMDGHLRLAMVCEARQQPEAAAAHYRQAAACLGDESAELRADFLRQADKLSPPS